MVFETLVHIGSLTVDGLSRGVIYALLGLGITLVFGLGGILNLALGVFCIIAILIVFELAGTVPLIIAMMIAIVATAIFGFGIERTLLQLVYRSEGEERLLLGIFVTLGITIALDGMLKLRYQADYSIPGQIPSYQIFGTFIRGSSIIIITVGLITLFGMYLFFSRTKSGLATRTIMQDETGAVLCGIDTSRMRTAIWTLSVGIAALTGILYGLSFDSSVSYAFQLTIYAIIVSIVGGVTSISGVVIAGIGLGIITTFVTAYMGAYLATISLFAIAIVVLLVKPGGLR